MHLCARLSCSRDVRDSNLPPSVRALPETLETRTSRLPPCPHLRRVVRERLDPRSFAPVPTAEARETRTSSLAPVPTVEEGEASEI